MGEAFLDYKKGRAGLDINGIIEDYYVYAGENVNAGDFVEFVGELYMVFKPLTNFAFNTLGEAYRSLQIRTDGL